MKKIIKTYLQWVFSFNLLIQKGILFGLTVVSTFILPYYNSYSSFLLFSLFLGIVGLLSTFSWSLFGSIFQKLLVKHNQLFNMIMAVLLVFSAVSIVIH